MHRLDIHMIWLFYLVCVLHYERDPQKGKTPRCRFFRVILDDAARGSRLRVPQRSSGSPRSPLIASPEVPAPALASPNGPFDRPPAFCQTRASPLHLVRRLDARFQALEQRRTADRRREPLAREPSRLVTMAHTRLIIRAVAGLGHRRPVRRGRLPLLRLERWARECSVRMQEEDGLCREFFCFAASVKTDLPPPC